MKGKYTLYAIVVIALTSGINWMNMFSSASSSSSGSNWNSRVHTSGGSWGGGLSGNSGSHK